MDKEILDQLKDQIIQLTSAVKDDKLILNSKEIELNKDKFFYIPNNTQEPEVIFIDGGNSDILLSSNFVLSFIRVAAISFENNKRKSIHKKEFFALTKATQHGFVSSFFGKDALFHEQLTFNLEKIEDASCLVRKVSEYCYAEQQIQIQNPDFIVLDGDMTLKHPLEQKYFQKLSELINQSGKGLAALSKTTRLLSKNHISAPILLAEHFKGSEGFFEADKAEISTFFLKLAKNGNYIFKLNTLNHSDTDKNSLIAFLHTNSQDPTFLGYPYGLILADQFARVSNEERDYLTTKITSSLGEDFAQLKQSISSLDAHSVLDNIN